jgi:hypothetical protein
MENFKYFIGKNTEIILSMAHIKTIMPAPGVIMTKHITCKVVKHIHLVYRGISKHRVIYMEGRFLVFG